MSTYEQAVQIATEAHKGQKDKGGVDYIQHPLHVASQLTDRQAKIVAVLHDIVEDTSTELADLFTYGFSADVVNAVDVITKKSGQTYKEYITGVKGNTLARLVKIEDIKHNMDLSRLKTVQPWDRKRIAKYQRALDFLCEIQKEEL